MLGCRDGRVRVISGSLQTMDLPMDSSVTCVANYSPMAPATAASTWAGAGRASSYKEIVYATQRGQIGTLMVRVLRVHASLLFFFETTAMRVSPSVACSSTHACCRAAARRD